MKKPLILLSNDDGISAPGLHTLYKEMLKLGEVQVVAPESEQSAVGHAITLKNPLRIHRWNRNGNFFGIAVNGYPADCVKLALAELVERKPDLVVSGVNQGTNTGVDIIYSGTVSGATEGAINGIPSIAVSLSSFTYNEFDFSAQFARRVAVKVLEEGLPDGTFLNINIPPLPPEEIKGVLWTRQGLSRYVEKFVQRIDLKGRPYYWMGGDKVRIGEDLDTDDRAIMEGYISITPVHYDLTNHQSLKTLSQWNFSFT